MTVTYTAEVATCKKFGCFVKLLARWRGSIYKLVWMDLLLFLALYYGINLIYIYLLDKDSQKTFESVVYYCASYSSLIPLSFVLGFYVNLVMTRWWEQYITIPWPDSVAVYVSAHVHDQDERGRVMRRTVMRYVCLCLTIVFTMISPCVKKRFPKMKHLVEAGLLLENEKKIIESMDVAFPKYPKHWMPIIWAASIITRARNEGLIRDDFAVKTIIDELNSFRGRCGTLMYYDFINIPLVYTQVVTIAVYSFFVCSLLAHQWTEFKKNTYEGLDFYMPLFITLQFFFYMGWLKVAETLINPFGEDDDDFEVNWMIDRNLQVSYLIVDEMHHEHPELVKDQYWDDVYPNELPYESEAKREQHPEHSTAKYDVDESLEQSFNKIYPSGETGSAIDSLGSIEGEILNRVLEKRSSEPLLQENSSSDVESVQKIVSYRSSEFSENILWKKDENDGKSQITLDTISEDKRLEHEKSEIMGEEESCQEEGEEVQDTYESETEVDPFEQLRLERQWQRIQRMHDFLQRYFGPHFKIEMPQVIPDNGTLTKSRKACRKRTKEESNSVENNTSMESNLREILDNLPIKGMQIPSDVSMPFLVDDGTSPMSSAKSYSTAGISE
ncbi:bestrophin-4-like [Musca domestica]|uniref:Bestrophin homolog n=1 Tax=Musca domestica TaxID=7370 RepID=A0ABM3UT51_MUSDO|nr:bestrophin-4-like [Musca domestica]